MHLAKDQSKPAVKRTSIIRSNSRQRAQKSARRPTADFERSDFQVDKAKTVIVTTKFSRLRQLRQDPSAVTPALIRYESLTALAEALDLLAAALTSLAKGEAVDPTRLRRLEERAASLGDVIARRNADTSGNGQSDANRSIVKDLQAISISSTAAGPHTATSSLSPSDPNSEVISS
jgi:hypothetical protein